MWVSLKRRLTFCYSTSASLCPYSLATELVEPEVPSEPRTWTQDRFWQLRLELGLELAKNSFPLVLRAVVGLFHVNIRLGLDHNYCDGVQYILLLSSGVAQKLTSIWTFGAMFMALQHPRCGVGTELEVTAKNFTTLEKMDRARLAIGPQGKCCRWAL